MATSVVTAWDASGNPATPAAPSTQQPTAWDANGNPVTHSGNGASQQPNFGEKVIEGAKESIIGQTVQASRPPENATEHVISNIGGPQTLVAYRMAKVLVDSAENMMSPKAAGAKYSQAVQDFQRFAQDFHNRDWRNLASDVGSTSSDVMGTMPGMGVPAERARELSEGARPGGNLATPVTKDVLDIGAMAAGGKAAAEGEAGSETPGIVQQIRQGKAVERTTANPAIRESVGAGSDVPILKGNQTVFDQKIGDLASKKASAYKQIDDAVGFDLKAAKQELSDNQYAIKQPGADKQKIQGTINQLQSKISSATQTLKDRGIDPSVADKLNQQWMAGKQIKKALVTSTDSEGNVNVAGFLNRIKALRFDKMGDRPAQFFGSDATDKLTQALQDAHDQGIRAVSRQQMFKMISRWTVRGAAAGVAGGAGYELFRHATE